MMYVSDADAENIIRAINLAYHHTEERYGRDVYNRYKSMDHALLKMIEIADEFGTVKRPVTVYTDYPK